jgi:pimeloyl-ACP methyl ester carboxylesterase
MSRTPLDATTAYYRTIPGVGLLRGVLAFLQGLWPALALRAACRLFLTPLPPKWLVRGKPWSKNWLVRTLPFEGASVTLYEQGDQGPTVLLAHGWGGHAGQMNALAAALLEAGMRPVLMDMPAHGRSAGLQSSLPQFVRAIDYVVARLGEAGRPVSMLLAHSLGATGAAFSVARNLPVERLVLVAPAASPQGYTRLFAHVFGLSERLRAGLQHRIEGREGVLMQNFEPHVLGAQLRVPTLVVHDRKDTINRFSDGEAYVAAIPGAKLLATDGLGHRAVLKDAAVVREVVAFASGRDTAAMASSVATSAPAPVPAARLVRI